MNSAVVTLGYIVALVYIGFLGCGRNSVVQKSRWKMFVHCCCTLNQRTGQFVVDIAHTGEVGMGEILAEQVENQLASKFVSVFLQNWKNSFQKKSAGSYNCADD